MGDGRYVLDGVYRLCRLLAGGADCPALLRATLQEALALTGSTGGAVFLLEPERRVLRAFFREGAEWPEGTEILADAPGWHITVCEGRTVLFRPPAAHAVPAEQRRFRKDEAEFLSALAAQSATAIENAQLYQTMLATQERLRQSECLAALGSMSAGLAHEIRNPLHTMQLLASAMQQDHPPHSPLWADVEVMQKEIRRLTLLVEQFLDFARPQSPQVTCLKLHEIMEGYPVSCRGRGQAPGYYPAQTLAARFA